MYPTGPYNELTEGNKMIAQETLKSFHKRNVLAKIALVALAVIALVVITLALIHAGPAALIPLHLACGGGSGFDFGFALLLTTMVAGVVTYIAIDAQKKRKALLEKSKIKPCDINEEMRYSLASEIKEIGAKIKYLYKNLNLICRSAEFSENEITP